MELDPAACVALYLVACAAAVWLLCRPLPWRAAEDAALREWAGSDEAAARFLRRSVREVHARRAYLRRTP